MNNCRTSNPAYNQTPNFNYTDADEAQDNVDREVREDEFWDVFVHGDKDEAMKLAETIMLKDDDLYQAAIKAVADAMAVSMPKSAFERQADSSGRDYMNECLNDGSDTWSES